MTYESTASDIIFQSTLSMRRATKYVLGKPSENQNFNPRSP